MHDPDMLVLKKEAARANWMYVKPNPLFSVCTILH